MLRVIGYQPSMLEAIEIDEWCPLTVNWGRATSGVHAWWRTGDDAGKSFLEIRLDPDSGRVCSLSLVLVPLIIYLPERRLFPDVPHTPGLPVCDLHRWQDDNYLTDSHPFAVSLYKDCLAIEFLPGAAASSVLLAGRTRFGMDTHGNLISVEVVALSGQELWTLREYHTVIG